MNTLFRTSAALAVAVCIAGCASPGPATPPAATVTAQGTKVIPAARMEAIAIGKSTRAEMLAALGETLVISFESGFEVWVYRVAGEKPAQAIPERGAARGPESEAATGEFVVLVAPSGVVAKTRIRAPSSGDPQLRP